MMVFNTVFSLEATRWKKSDCINCKMLHGRKGKPKCWKKENIGQLVLKQDVKLNNQDKDGEYW